MKKQTGGSVPAVQVETKGEEVVELTSQTEVHKAIWSNIHQQHFYLAEEAPICNGAMREVFGFNVDSEVGKEVLEGMYKYEDGFDEHTKDTLQEAAHT
jgi:hypothetical protein